MPKIKNTKHKVSISNLPEGFELVDGNLVKKSHGGLVTGDQNNYGLVTFNPHPNSSNEVGNTDVRYSLSSVPRDIANIEAEGGETVLTDLSNDGNYGLYNITGPRHSKGGVPMYLPEQSFIYSDTDKMKMNETELAEFGIESKKKKTPASVSKGFQLNKYYGLLKDEYADKIQANSAELMLEKNQESLSKLAFGQELKKDFEEGVPVASHPYLMSIGLDPMEFTAQVEQRKQGGQGQMGEQPMSEADMQAMSAMRYGGQRFDTGGVPGHPHENDGSHPLNNFIPAAQSTMMSNPANLNQNPINLNQNPGGVTANVIANQSNPNTTFNQVANMSNTGATSNVSLVPALSVPSYEDPTVERTNKKKLGARMEQGLARFMDSPTMNKVGEIGAFGINVANVGNQIALNTKANQAEIDMTKGTMADNAFGVVENDNNSQGYWDTNTGLINQNMQGRGPSGFEGAYNRAEYGMELPTAQDGEETSYKEGETYRGGTKEWNDWYQSDDAKDYKADRYEAYKARREAVGKQALDADAYHDVYLRGQKQINAIQQRYKDNQSTLVDSKWDASQNDFYNKQIGLLNADIEAENAAGLAADPDYVTQPLYKGLSDSEVGDFQSGYIGGMYLKAADADSSNLANMVHEGVNDQTITMPDGTAVNISPEDMWFGDTTVGQWENFKIPETPETTVVPEGCDDCPEGTTSLPTEEDPCNCEPIKELTQITTIPEVKSPGMEPFIQDVLKTNAIANRRRDVFLPWEPAEQKGRYEFALEDPTRLIAASNSDANAAMKASGSFAGAQALGSRSSAIQGQNAKNIADAIGGVNQRNVGTINRGNQITSQLEDVYNQRNNASKKRVYDNTTRSLQLAMDEQNFDNEQYADQMANQITNASNAYNANSMRDYYAIDPSTGGNIYQKGSRALEASPEANRFAAIDNAAEMAERYFKTTGRQATEAMMNTFMGLGQTALTPNETRMQREYRNQPPYLKGSKKGGAIKKWASPFYTGKMGV